MKKQKAQPDLPRCANCEHYHADSPADDCGYCWRYPPIWIVEDGEEQWARPVVETTELCGEYSRKLNS